MKRQFLRDASIANLVKEKKRKHKHQNKMTLD